MLDRWTGTARALAIAIGIVALFSVAPVPSAYPPALAQGSPAAPQQQKAAASAPAAALSGKLCGGDGTPLPPEKFAGKWTSRSRLGVVVEIAQDDPKDPAHFTLHGSHDWQGAFADGKLTFKRKPTVDEMDEAADPWARQAVNGQIEWTLELDPKEKCGKYILEGKWFPGRIEVIEELDAAGQVTKRRATSDGKGAPIDVRFERLPPRVFGVLVMEDQTGEAGEGIAAVPDYPYPFPLKITEPKRGEPRSQREEYNPFFFSIYSEAADKMNGWNLEARQQNRTGTGTRRTLYLYGQGLPRSWKDIKHITKDITPGLGARGVTYSILAFSSDKPENLLETYKEHFRQGRARAVAQLASDPAAADLALHADAILIRVDLGSEALPGYKDFKLQDIPGPTQWRLQFGDDRALISFGRDANDEVDLVDYLFLPERTFIEIKTEVPLPVDEIPLKVQINGKPITWPGSPTLIAKRVPGDWSKRTYRTATIELVEDGNPQGPAEPGVVFLAAHVHDELLARPADPGLLRVQSRPAVVLRTPGEMDAVAQTATAAEADAASKQPFRLGPTEQLSAATTRPTRPVLLWKEALKRAAAVGKVDVTDWDRIPEHEAAKVSNIILYNFGTTVLDKVAELAPYDPTAASTIIKGTQAQKELLEAAASWANRKIFGGTENFQRNPNDTTIARVSVTVADLAALLMFRDEFRRRMADALRDDGGAFPAVTDRALVLGLRERLKGSGPDKTGWDYLQVTCPRGESCEFTKVLDDDFLKRSFKDDNKAAEKWLLQAMAEAITKYKDFVRKAKLRADLVQDRDVLGLISLIAADCTAETFETPCGYQALRPLLLPRMVRLIDIPSPAAMQAALKAADQRRQQFPSEPPMTESELTGLALQQPGERPRHLWIPDYNGRSVLRNLHTLIAAAKAQSDYSKADTAVAKSLASLLAMPAASVLTVSESAAAGSELLQGGRALLQALGACLSDAICGTILQELPTTIAEYDTVVREVEFAQGAALVLGTSRLDAAVAAKSAFYKNLAQTVFWTLLQEAPALAHAASELRSAEIAEEIQSLRQFQALSREDQTALLRVELNVKLLEELGEKEVISEFDRRIEAAMDKVLGEAGVDPERLARAEQETVRATGDSTLTQPREEPVAAEPDPQQAEEIAAADREELDEASKTEVMQRGGQEKTERDLVPRTEVQVAKLKALADQPVPVKGGKFQGEFNGEIVTFTLGDPMGTPSKFASVWELAAPKIPGCEAGCVIKIYTGNQGEAEAVFDIVAGARYLGDDIPQPKLFDPETTMNSPRPFLIQEKLHFDQTNLIDLGKVPIDEAVAKFSADPGMSDAVVEMLAKIKNKELAAPDLHKANIFLEKVENGWVGGTFDTDQIAPYAERVATTPGSRYRPGEVTRVGKYFAHAELAMILGNEKVIKGLRVEIGTLNSLRQSKTVLEEAIMSRYIADRFPDSPKYKVPFSELSPADQQVLRRGLRDYLWNFADHNPEAHFANAEIMMIKVMEQKGYIRYDLGERRWYGNLLYPGKPLEQTRMKDLFPLMFEPDHTAPVDARGPFYKTGDARDGSGASARVFDLADFRARRCFDAVPSLELRQAA